MGAGKLFGMFDADEVLLALNLWDRFLEFIESDATKTIKSVQVAKDKMTDFRIKLKTKLAEIPTKNELTEDTQGLINMLDIASGDMGDIIYEITEYAKVIEKKLDKIIAGAEDGK